MRLWGNDYDRRELAGAFGDIGTLIPFVMGYVTLNGLDPVGILVSFGLFSVLAGLYFRTPLPVQPMKAIGGMAIAHPSTVSAGMIGGAGLFTGVFWLVLGLTGAVDWIERITAKPVVRGIMLGLGLSFLSQGLDMMRADPLFAIAGAVLTLRLLGNPRVPAMLALIAFGAVVLLVRQPDLARDLSHLSVRFRLPEFGLGKASWGELATGFLVLGLPQLPLTLGNAVIATAATNNSLFPNRPVTARALSLDHGVMNLVSAGLGGVPLCHGAGGMAAHVRFGARTGGALVLLGTGLLLTGLFLGDSVSVLLRLFPRPILGVILFFAGVELALSIRDVRLKRPHLFVLVVTAGTAMWNMGVAYLAGLTLYYGIQRRWFRV